MVLRCSLLFLLAIGCAPATTTAPLAESERGVDVGAVLQVHSLAGRTVRVVAGDAPGETELFLGEQPLAPHAGPDEQPLILQDSDDVVFVSGRSGVASLWKVDVVTGALVQLTNVGLRPGKLDGSFVPPPARTMSQDGDDVVYDDGSGRVWRVAAAGPQRGAIR
ncbi:MAG: hypothetical protein Q8O67_07360 [Deltaproteobacteria bacterium]|nr:hypothetical protein [Deltaproteobacteria bacterium]